MILKKDSQYGTGNKILFPVYNCNTFCGENSSSKKLTNIAPSRNQFRVRAIRGALNMARGVTGNDADPDPWIKIYIIKVGSGSAWRDTKPDPDPGLIW